ncbi:ABC transporter ATP-binding protein [Vibrio penaeicida]|uniref:Fe(3+) ions import ATP-binding protein FbpC 1 n=1 Tax=Vibrio penaeicida TaxID=104609 RepID=A0AAV5NW59_9VIBR|nr:ABC transporter ATP-binding protein [Vibrio penaeicida]RTZ20555.1 ABC transporter ATP-binding protein [Vibrio penaeicida]GLQ74675.1 Fe(3+) ions import ATP-binding protein FbpC 1 [Vibrio penaeicida]
MNSSKKGAVDFSSICKKYGDFTAVPDLDFQLRPGELVTLLGPSGCGKTTTLRMLAGLEHPSSGSIKIGGRDVTNLPANERDVAMVFQSYALFPHMSVAENVQYGLISGGMPKNLAITKAEEGLSLVGLDGYGERLPSELSGGQQQRVAVARALVLEPQVLLLDEPLSNLDARLRRKVRTDIREIQQKLNLTALYVTHDQDEALAVSDRVVIMNNGQIEQVGTPKELYSQPENEFVADFIGEANLVDCLVVGVNEGVAKIDVLGYTFELNCAHAKVGNGRLAVRPGAIQISSSPEANTLSGKVKVASFLGDHMEYEIETAAGDLFAIADNSNSDISTNQEVSIHFRQSDLALLKQGGKS